MSEMNQFSHNILRSVVAQIFKAIGWKSSSSVCIQVLVDVLHQYLKQLCSNLRDCADKTGRQTPSMQEVSMLIKLMKIDLDDLEEYMHFVDPIDLGFTVPKYPFLKEPSLNVLKPGSAEVLIRPPHVHEHLPPMYPHLEDATIKSEENKSIGDLLSNDPLTSTIQSQDDKESKEREILQKCKKYNISREEGRPERTLTCIAMTSSGFLTSSREGRVADSRLPPEFARDDSPEMSTEQRKRRKSFDKKSTDSQKHSKKKEESKKRPESHYEGSWTKPFTEKGGIDSTEHGSLSVDHKKSQILEKCKKGTGFVTSTEEKGHGSSHKHKHRHKKTSKEKINDFGNADIGEHNGIDNSVRSVTKHSPQIVSEPDMKDKKNLKRTHDQCMGDLGSGSSNNSSVKVSKRGRKKRKLSTDNIYPDDTEGTAKKSFTSIVPSHLPKYPSTPLGPGLIPSIGQDSLLERFSSPFVSDVRGMFSERTDAAVSMEVSIENENTFEDVEHNENEEGEGLDEHTAEKEKKKSKKEHKKKKDKKEKSKKKDKNKDKSEKKKEKCKKHKKSHHASEDADERNEDVQQVAVPKFKLKLGKKSQIEVASMSMTDQPVASPQLDNTPKQASTPRMNLPEVDIKPTKTKTKTAKITSMEPAPPVTIGQSAFKNSKSETSAAILQPPVQKRGRGRPRKNEIVIPKVPKRPAAFYYDIEGNQVWVCPTCGIQDDGSPMIGCDGCDAWYHWACIGMISAPVSKKWFCPVCAKS